MSDWTWQDWQGTKYLTCRLLAPWKHGFFTREFWPNLPNQLTQALEPDAQVCRVKQVHGNRVLTGGEMQQQVHPNPEELPEDESPYPHADGLYSDANSQALWVCSADCTPVLIGDRQTGQVAALHAGWRGTAARIVPEAIEKLQRQGSRLEDLNIAMGPAIAGAVYQVTEAVAEQMAASLKDSVSDHSLSALAQSEHPPFLSDDEPGKIKLDVRRVNAMQIEALGIDSSQISIAPHCTFQDPERFFSYRRDGLKKVQWSGIVSQGAP